MILRKETETNNNKFTVAVTKSNIRMNDTP